MIDRIIELSAQNRFLVFLFVAAASLAGWWSMNRIPLDAIPDLSDTQVIVYSRWDRSPDILEDQVTYPIVSAMLGAPQGEGRARVQRLRLLVRLHHFRGRHGHLLGALADARVPLEDSAAAAEGCADENSGRMRRAWGGSFSTRWSRQGSNLAAQRSVQDWFLRYHLQAVPGRGGGRAVGGFVRQYQVNVDPNRLAAYGVPIAKVVAAVRTGEQRCRRTAGGVHGTRVHGARARLRTVGGRFGITVAGGQRSRARRSGARCGSVTLGPDMRRGVADLNGQGEVVSGIIVMRQGENALHVIERVKAKIKEIEPGLPAGVKLVTTYDRRELILASIDNLKHTLTEELIVVGLVILIFLWHVPSAIIPIVTIPIAVLISFVPMHAMGMSSNIMSLGGIAIAVGAMVDAAIVVVEQTHKRLEGAGPEWTMFDYQRAIVNAVKEVGGTSFFALLVIAVSFLPVLTLEAQEGRLFKPLAYTKNFAMVMAAVLAITLDPALRLFFFRKDNFRIPGFIGKAVNAILVGKIHSEEKHPISRILMRLYEPVVAWSLRWKWFVIAGALGMIAATIPIYQRLGSEFMPPLDEGALVFMPTTLPGISVTEAQRLMQAQDRILMSFPEVAERAGEIGARGDIHRPGALLDDGDRGAAQAEIRDGARRRPGTTRVRGWLRPLLSHITPDHISTEQLVAEMDQALQIPGRVERLDDADQEPDRHADHGRADAGRHQGVRPGPGGDRADRQGD